MEDRGSGMSYTSHIIAERLALRLKDTQAKFVRPYEKGSCVPSAWMDFRTEMALQKDTSQTVIMPPQERKLLKRKRKTFWDYIIDR